MIETIANLYMYTSLYAHTFLVNVKTTFEKRLTILHYREINTIYGALTKAFKLEEKNVTIFHNDATIFRNALQHE